MLKGFVGRFFCGVSALVALTSCGSEDLGAGIGEFTTVNASVVADTNRLESDISTGNACTNGTSTGGTIETDSVNVVVTSTAQFATGALNLKIGRIIVRYQPKNPATTPPLDDYIIPASNQTVLPNTSATIPVAVLPDSYKVALLTRSTLNLNLCSLDIFEYFVTILVEVSEPGGNGKVREVPTSLTVAIADRS